jgi:hypothetical protein
MVGYLCAHTGRTLDVEAPWTRCASEAHGSWAWDVNV